MPYFSKVRQSVFAQDIKETAPQHLIDEYSDDMTIKYVLIEQCLYYLRECLTNKTTRKCKQTCFFIAALTFQPAP